MKKVLFFLLGCILCKVAVAQSGKPVRLEFPSEKYSVQIKCLLCDTLGLCVAYPTANYDTLYCNILQYDVQLQKTNESRIPINAQLGIAASAYHDGSIYLLYQTYNKKKKEPTGILLTYHLQTATSQWREINNIPTSDIRQFTVQDGNVFFLSTHSYNQSNIYYIPLNDNYVHQLLVPNAPDYTIDDYVVDNQAQRVMVCMNTSSNSKNNVIWMCETDFAGNAQKVIDFPDTGSYRFQNARIARISDNRFLLTGTYQERKTSGNKASGIYSLVYENHSFQEPRLYSYLSSAIGGKDDLLYLASAITSDDSLFSFVTESFYPEYRYSTTYHYGVPSTESIFMGYRFINAQVNIFNTDGQRLWEYSFPFDNLMVTNLTTHLRTTFLSDYILHHYTLNTSTTTMLTDKQFQLEDPIRTSELFSQTNQKSMQTNYTLNRWYDNYFILSGFRFHQGSKKDSNPIFFINKIRYQ